MRCPRCGSENIREVNSTYPKAYECLSCGFIFMKPVNALRDEGL